MAANVIDYLGWRGDLPFGEYPFNEVDNLILSELVYMDWEGIVPESGKGSVTLGEAVKEYFRKHIREKAMMGLIIPDSILDLAVKAGKSKRFMDLKLSAFVNSVVHEEAKQFAAMTVTGIAYDRAVIFRGTDDTIAGWRENFNMSFMTTVPAQECAVAYLEEQAALAPKMRFYVCGHSKGGNLAVYAAANCSREVQDRIIRVFNNDGPGFLVKPSGEEGYLRIKDRVFSLLPSNSVVGILLEHVESFKVVISTATGIGQHDGMTWEIVGTKFVYGDALAFSSQQTEQTLHAWLYGLSMDDRKALVNGLFDTLDATGSHTLKELSANRANTAKVIIDRLRAMNGKDREFMTHTIQLLLRGRANVFRSSLSLLAEGLHL